MDVDLIEYFFEFRLLTTTIWCLLGIPWTWHSTRQTWTRKSWRIQWRKRRPGTWYEQSLKNDTRVERTNGSSTSWDSKLPTFETSYNITVIYTAFGDKFCWLPLKEINVKAELALLPITVDWQTNSLTCWLGALC